MNMNTKEKIKIIEKKLLKFFKDENRENKNNQSKEEPRQSDINKGQ